MATAVENLNRHLQSAVRQLKIVSGIVNEIPHSTFELAIEEIYGLLLSLTDPGTPEKRRDQRSLLPQRG